MVDQETISLIEDKLDGREAALRTVAGCLDRADDGELFIEQRRNEAFVWDDGRLEIGKL